MYRHVTLRERVSNGKASWVLLGPNGRLIYAFSAFANALRNSPKNTRDSYCRHLAEFLDYLIEATALFGNGQLLTKLQLRETLEAYGDYLLLGENASSPIASAVAGTLQPSLNAASSVISKKAAIRRFLNLSEQIRNEISEQAHLYGSQLAAASTPLLPELGQKRLLLPHEIRGMEANSVLASVIAGGPKLIASVPLGDAIVATPYDEQRAFPYDKVMDFLDATPTYRDKTHYAKLAATGCRAHESLQCLLHDDIDVEEGIVRLVDPATRPGHPSYRALTPAQRGRLAWKGRTSDLTLLIEPFATVFFESLQKYLELEYIPHGKHDFLLQYLNGPEKGLPYFLSAPGSRLESFHKLCKYVGVKLPPHTGPHSFRHMYGTYTLNYFPRANGDFGLPVSIVQILLGHANPKDTLKYAKFDKDLLKLEAENANRALFKKSAPKKLLELKLEALLSQVAKVRHQLAEEALVHD